MKIAIVFFIIGLGQGVLMHDWYINRTFNRADVKKQVLKRKK